MARMIDPSARRGRFDPPRFPAPVSPQGYHILFRNDLMGLDPSHLSITISAGAFEHGANENGVTVWPNTDHFMWRDAERGIEILDAMIQCWDTEWACAYAFAPRSRSENGKHRVEYPTVASVDGQAASAAA